MVLLKKSGSPRSIAKGSTCSSPLASQYKVCPALLLALCNVSETNKIFGDVCSVNSTLRTTLKRASCLSINTSSVIATRITVVNSLWSITSSKVIEIKGIRVFLCACAHHAMFPSPAEKGLLTHCRETCSQMFLIQLNNLIGNTINYMYRPVSTIFNRSNMSSVGNKTKTSDQFLNLLPRVLIQNPFVQKEKAKF